ncbi:TlpA family protein disulfide reductase [Sinimarinibacterium sp. CAU 1509]|uniref:redoxin family protein n=1 Tax=Sinimarinibacterium sp. CAU 1509 TaxID=2562283 RepID=UPI0010ABDE0A|nr:redoxin family protein [Sinimarinibacterium sp. CAU 1509]TJY55418.1 TlpA family protein disulfide reductase [Sinimarinibacterium sp. CAU 1509]
MAPAPPWHVSAWFNAPQPLSLEGLRGRVIVLHAFQMLCPGCVSHSVPQAERVHRLLAADDVAVVGLHTVFEHHAAMTPVALQAFLHEYRVTHTVGVDAARPGEAVPATMHAYGMQGTPTLCLIDRTGRLRLQHFGRLDDMVIGAEIMALVHERGDNAAATLGKSRSDGIAGCAPSGCAVNRDERHS